MTAYQLFDEWKNADGRISYRIGVDVFQQTFRLMVKEPRHHWRFVESLPARRSFADALADTEAYATDRKLSKTELFGQSLWNIYMYQDVTRLFLVRSKDGKFRLMEREHRMYARPKYISDFAFPPSNDFFDAIKRADSFAKRKPVLATMF